MSTRWKAGATTIKLRSKQDSSQDISTHEAQQSLIGTER